MNLSALGVVFKLLNLKTVMELNSEKWFLPAKTLNVAKDELWVSKLLNSAVLQGILSGNSITGIADRISSVVTQNAMASTRTARTMVTSAENLGRMDSYHELESQGVIMKKVWLATQDDRTRESHLELDGQERDIDDEFGNGLEYPGDPSGAPEEIYNCRCTLTTRIIGVRR